MLDRSGVPGPDSGRADAVAWTREDTTPSAARIQTPGVRPLPSRLAIRIDPTSRVESCLRPVATRSSHRRLGPRSVAERRGDIMGLSFTVGGTQGTFEERFANEVAGRARQRLRRRGGLGRGRPRATSASSPGPAGPTSSAGPSRSSGDDAVPNLLALGEEGRGRLPARARPGRLAAALGRARRSAAPACPASAASWPSWPSAGTCRSTTTGSQDLLQVHRDPDDGWVADAPEILAFARLALAANEAVRRDCPLWLVG